MSSTSDEIPTTGSWRAATPRGEAALDLVAGSAASTLLASDFDGTLSPIVEDPTQARMHPAAREALLALGPRVGQLAIVTGREVPVVLALGELEGAAGLERLRVLGQYGLESWDAATGELSVPPVPAMVDQARAEVEALLAAGLEGVDLSGVALEDKGRAIGIHTRRCADPEGVLGALQPRVQLIAECNGMVLEPGRNVLELRSSQVSKGDALAGLVDQVQPRVVVMMGDDLGDLPAFARIRALEEEGRCTAVCVVAASPEQPAVAEQADVLCGGPQGVAAWLGELVAALPARPGGDGTPAEVR